VTSKKPGTFDLGRLSRYDLSHRPSKVHLAQFGKPVRSGMTTGELLDALPDILAAKDIKELARSIAKARKNDRPVHMSMGAHVIKVGLAPLLIDLMEQKVLTSLSFNGAVLIHDYETAAAGKTSEDVDSVLDAGKFGMAEQTGGDLSAFIKAGVTDGLGLAQSVGRGIATGNYPHSKLSVLARAWELGIPITAHPALGTDILHLWPDLDWGLLGQGAQRDFLTFCALVEDFGQAVYLNIGSAVVLPEVFLKAVSATRNAGADHTGLVTADFDFIRQYRAQTNVVRRPTMNVGKGFALTGHHEIMLSLLFAAVFEYWDQS
jgi:hypothetical protein